ncbi:MAG: hypothetical protein IT266_11420 [Saprospiraceae bacterium]|nr:hypothetical protein [Saprospiraceae bacterium]
MKSEGNSTKGVVNDGVSIAASVLARAHSTHKGFGEIIMNFDNYGVEARI